MKQVFGARFRGFFVVLKQAAHVALLYESD